MKSWVWIYILLILFFTGCSTGNPSISGSTNHLRNDSAYQIPISLSGSLQNPAWSPDGNSIVFTRFQNGYNEGPADLVVYEFSSKTTKVLVSDGSDNVNLPGSAWNQATNQIIFSSSREPHDEIYLLDMGDPSGKEIRITDRGQTVAYEPSLSPDGEWIVFESHEVDVETNGIITKNKIDGSQPYQSLTGLRDDCRQPNWSPSGKHIVYQRFKGGQWEIWVMNPDGSHPHQITDGPGDKTDASFSPDGQWIVYSADSPDLKLANLFIIPVSGGEPTQITNFDGYDGAPSWSPDGNKIAFESSLGDPDESAGTTIWIIEISKP